MKANFASGGNISKMKTEDGLRALNIDASKDKNLNKIAAVLAEYNCSWIACQLHIGTSLGRRHN